MGLFDKIFGAGNLAQGPAWAPFFAPHEADIFDGAVESALRERELSFEMGDGSVSVRRGGGPALPYPLAELAKACSAIDPQQWSELVGKHFDQTFRTDDLIAAARKRVAHFDGARALLRVILHPTDDPAIAGTSRHILREMAPGLQASLALDLPDLPPDLSVVTGDQVSFWSTPVDDLFEVALANVQRAVPLKPVPLPAGADGSIVALENPSRYAASHALFLDQHFDRPAPHGALVAVPTRQRILFHPIHTDAARAALDSLATLARALHAAGPDSLRPDVYWMRDDGFVEIPVRVEAGAAVALPPKALERLFATLPSK